LIDDSVEAAIVKGRSSTAVQLAQTQSREREALIVQRASAENSLVALKGDMAVAQGEQAKVSAEIGVLEYAANLFGVDRERMIQVLILAMVLTCDPLSIMLVIATARRKVVTA
jgi:hypothetical protein